MKCVRARAHASSLKPAEVHEVHAGRDMLRMEQRSTLEDSKGRYTRGRADGGTGYRVPYTRPNPISALPLSAGF